MFRGSYPFEEFFFYKGGDTLTLVLYFIYDSKG